MDLAGLIESLIRQKIVSYQGSTPLSEEVLVAQVLKTLKDQGIQIEEQSSAALKTPAKNKVACGSDHGGFALKEILIPHLRKEHYEVIDLGTFNEEAVDYPDFAQKVAEYVSQGHCSRGIIIDGAGIGSCMTANKVVGVRAAHCHNIFEARNAREHNNSNVLSLGGRVIGTEFAKAIVMAWLETDFAGGRHQKRVDKIMAVEQKYSRSLCPNSAK